MFGDPDHPEKNSVMKIINKIIIIPGKEKIKEIPSGKAFGNSILILILRT